MKREVKNIKTDVDLSKPLLLELADKSSCYGKLYDATHRDCSVCADNLTCSVYTMRNLNKVVKAKEVEGQFLDAQDFKKVPTDKVSELIKKTRKQPVKGVLRVINTYSGSKDPVAAMRFLVTFCKNNNLQIKDGYVYG